MRTRVLMVFLAALAVGSSLSTGGQSQEVGAGLYELPVPGGLTVYAARRAAASVVDDLMDFSEAQTDALDLADHLVAVARFQSELDRPRHAPIVETLTEEQGLQALRRRYRLRTNELQALNDGVDLDALGPGDQLTVWRHDPDAPARSSNRPNRGRLVNGELFPHGEGWVVADSARAFAAAQTIDAMVHGMRTVMARHPGGQELLIADISTINGGSMRPHRSHESGRDVDVTYYRRTAEPPTFDRCYPDDLDEKRTWTFLRTQIIQHDVVYVFMQRALQIRLYEYALSIGEHPGWVASVFQYGPDGHRNNRGVIRLAPGHHDHMHVRFACSPLDLRCRD